jgi:hypothetical protein
MENIDMHLSLRSFGFHYGTGDEWFDAGGMIKRPTGTKDEISPDLPSPFEIGYGRKDKSNLEAWAENEIRFSLDTLLDKSGEESSSIRNLYLVIPEKKQPYLEATRYESRDYFYPKKA